MINFPEKNSTNTNSKVNQLTKLDIVASFPKCLNIPRVKKPLLW